MTNEEFKDAQAKLEYSNEMMAKAMHYDISMIEHFRSGRCQITARSAAYIKMMLRLASN